MSDRLLILASLAAMMIGVGCVDHSTDVARYRALLDKEQPTSRPVAIAADVPLSLVDALRIANADNETIASSGESYIQALADKSRAASAFMPTLTLGPSYSLTRSRSSSSSSGVIVGDGSGTGGSVQIQDSDSDRTRHQLSAPLQARVNGSLSDLSSFDAARQTVAEREQLLYDTRESVLLQVVDAYYAVLRNERQVAVYESTVQLRTEQVRDQEARQRLGSARPLDVAQSQANLAATRVQLTQARTDAVNARSALARLMGVPAVTGALTDAFTLPQAIDALDAWQTRARTERQDLIAGQRALESARASVDAAIRQYFPSVSINFNYFLYNDPKSSQLWTGGISANVPIFSGGQIEADIRRAWSVYRQTGLAQSQTVHEVDDDVLQAFNNVQGSRAKLTDLTVQVDAATRSVDLAERAYKLGSESNLDRLTEQDNLLTARLNLLTEELNEKSFYLALIRATGGLGEVLTD